MLNKELITEYFVEAPVKSPDGRILPMPLVGELMFRVLQKSCADTTLPEGKTTMIAVGPKTLKDGTTGYSIRKELISIK